MSIHPAPPPPSGAEFLEAPKVPKKISGLTELLLKASEKTRKYLISRRPQKKIWLNL